MEVQGCRLPGLKTPQVSLQLPGATQAAADCSSSVRPWQCPFMEVQGCRLPGLKTPQTSPCSSQAPLRPRQTFLQLQQVPEAVAVSFYGGSRPYPQTSPCSSQAPLRPRQTFLQLQQVPEAVAVSFYEGSRLPFASLENSPNVSLQLPGATQAAADFPAAPTSP